MYTDTIILDKLRQHVLELGVHVTCGPAIPVPGIYPEEIHTGAQPKKYTGNLTAVPFVITPKMETTQMHIDSGMDK